jgi:hypothetical protein
MNLTRRFVFRGNASALAGQIYRPKTIIVDMDGASSLGVSGGRSQSHIKGRAFGDIIKFGSAFTLAQGLFDDPKKAYEVSNRKDRSQIELDATTTVTSELRELAVGRKPVFTAKRIRGTLVSRKPDGSGEPSIAPERDTVIQGVAIGGFGLTVSLNVSLFQKYDTRSKIIAAADDPKFVRNNGNHLVPGATIDGQPMSRPGLVARYGVIYTTIVKEIEWDGKPYPGAKIDGHSVIVPDLGTIFFGELYVASSERRLTMVRFDLGSPDGGWVDGGGVDSNGSFFP